MIKHELKNWLAALGVSGGMTVSVAAQAEPARPAAKTKPGKVGVDDRYVVINHEEQYSLWPANAAPPKGWTREGAGLGLKAAAAKLKDRGGHYVVINHEEQYSLWPKDQKPPKGWRVKGDACAAADCLGHLRKVAQPRATKGGKDAEETKPARRRAPAPTPKRR